MIMLLIALRVRSKSKTVGHLWRWLMANSTFSFKSVDLKHCFVLNFLRNWAWSSPEHCLFSTKPGAKMTGTARCGDETSEQYRSWSILCVFYLLCCSPACQYQNQLILGVMGIDVSLDDIKKLTPRFTVTWFYILFSPVTDASHTDTGIHHTLMWMVDTHVFHFTTD